MEKEILEKYRGITEELIRRKTTISTMESCTSGQIASLITDTEGSSEVYKGGYITYCNEAKIQNGVPAETIEKYGVYSKETATAMAAACRSAFGTVIGLGVTGSFGNPDPANQDSVPGHVDFAINIDGQYKCYEVKLNPNQPRHESKYVVADAIADALKKELT